MMADYRRFICVPIAGRTVSEAKRQIAYASRYGKQVELRLDYIGGVQDAVGAAKELAKYAKNLGLTVLCTARPKREGGSFEGSEKTRLALLGKCLAFADIVDVELSCGPKALERMKHLAAKRKKKLLVSMHDFMRTPGRESLFRIIEAQAKYGEIAKIAVAVENESDVVLLFEAMAHAKSLGIKSVVIGMSKKGTITRILGPLLCDSFGYFPIDTKHKTGPGQVSCKDYFGWLSKARPADRTKSF